MLGLDIECQRHPADYAVVIYKNIMMAPIIEDMGLSYAKATTKPIPVAT